MDCSGRNGRGANTTYARNRNGTSTSPPNETGRGADDGTMHAARSGSVGLLPLCLHTPTPPNMASKFSTLPDVDTTAIDVYETSSSPEIKPAPSRKAKKSTRSGAGNEDDDDDSDVSEGEGLGSARRSKGVAPLENAEIDVQGLDTLEAMRRFEGSVGVGGRGGAKCIQSQVETPAARLRRLKREMSELEKEFKGASDTQEDGSSSGTLVEQLRTLRTDLSRLGGEDTHLDSDRRLAQAKRLLDTLQSQPPSSTTATSATPASSTIQTPAHILASYETRLSSLEHFLGGTLDSSTRPLLPTLTRLEQLATLLTQPRHIDAISKRVKVLVSELDRVQETRRKLGTTDGDSTDPITSAKIQDLFALSTRLAPLVPVAPALLDRLRSLAALHSNASRFQGDLTALQTEQGEVKGSLQLFTDSLKQVELSLQDNQRRFAENLQGVMARIEELSRRVDAL